MVPLHQALIQFIADSVGCPPAHVTVETLASVDWCAAVLLVCYHVIPFLPFSNLHVREANHKTENV